MSEGVVSDIPLSGGSKKLPVTAGEMLRAAREREGLHVAALAVSMKVPVKKLEALESDRLDLLPDAVFVRALASSVCRALKIDPLPILNLLPPSTAPKLDVDERGLNAPFVSSARSTGFAFQSVLFRPPVLAVLMLLVAALAVLFYYPEERREERVPEVQAVSNPDINTVDAVKGASFAPAMASSAAVTAATEMPVTAGVSTVDGAISPVPPMQKPGTVSSTPALVAASAPAVLPLQAPKTLQEASSNVAPVAASNLLSLKAKGAVWVQVKDGKGVVLFSRTLQAGEFANVNGLLPLAVVIGRADLVSVDVRGSGFNVLGVAQDNVARFEVK